MDFREFGGGSRIVKTFADSFARADQPFGLGTQWGLYPVLSSGTTLIGPNIAASINVAGNQANFSICSSNGVNELLCYPIPITWNKVFFASQFSQAVISADNSGGVNFAFNGPAVMMNANAATGYFISTNTPDGGGTNVLGKFTVLSLNGAGATTKIHQNLNFAIGDLLRIEAVLGPSGTTINTYRNGVLQSSDLDAVGKYNNGLCGIFDYFVSAGVTQSWQSFLGGGL